MITMKIITEKSEIELDMSIKLQEWSDFGPVFMVDFKDA